MSERLTDETIRTAIQEFRDVDEIGLANRLIAIGAFDELLDARQRIAELEAENARLRGAAEYVGSDNVTITMSVEDESEDD